MSRIVCFDTETTGLDVKTDRLVSIHFQVLNDVESWGTKINPGIKIPKEASAIHKIVDDDVKECDSTRVALDKMRDWIFEVSTAMKAPLLLVAHNGFCYDQWILQFEWKRHMKTDFRQEFFKTLRFGCTLWTLTTRLPLMFKNPGSLKLQELYKRFVKKDYIQDHSAKGDVDALVEVVTHFKYDLVSLLQKESRPPHKFEDLLQYDPSKNKINFPYDFSWRRVGKSKSTKSFNNPPKKRFKSESK